MTVDLEVSDKDDDEQDVEAGNKELTRENRAGYSGPESACAQRRHVK